MPKKNSTKIFNKPTLKKKQTDSIFKHNKNASNKKDAWKTADGTEVGKYAGRIRITIV